MLSIVAQTTLELLMITLIIYGFCNEEKFIKFEQRLKIKFLKAKIKILETLLEVMK